MRLLIAALGLAIGLAASDARAETAISYPVYVVGSVGGGLGVKHHEVTVISRVALSRPSRQVIWIAERRRKNQKIRGRIVDHQWLDGRTCPALMVALEELRRLPAMQFGSPTTMADTSLAFDVPLSMLRGPPAGPLTRKDGVGVRLSRRNLWALWPNGG